MENQINLLLRNPYLPEYEFRIQVSSALTIGQLKQELEARYEGRPPVDAQRLVYAGRVLQDNDLVGELLQGSSNSSDSSEEEEHVFVLAVKRLVGESAPFKKPSLANSSSLSSLSTSSSSLTSSHHHSAASSATTTSSVFSPSSFSFGGAGNAAPAMSSYGTPVSFSSAPRSFTFSSSQTSSPQALNSFSNSLSSPSTSNDFSSASTSSDMANSSSPITPSTFADAQNKNIAPSLSSYDSSPLVSSYDEALKAYLSQASAYHSWMAQMYAYQYNMHFCSHVVQPSIDQATPVLYGTGLRYRLQSVEPQTFSTESAPQQMHHLPAQPHIPAPEPQLRAVAPVEILPPRVPLSFKLVLKLALLLAAGFALRSVLLVAFAIAWFVQQTGLLRGLRGQAPVIQNDNNNNSIDDAANVEVTSFVAVKRFFIGFFCSLMPSWRPPLVAPVTAAR